MNQVSSGTGPEFFRHVFQESIDIKRTFIASGAENLHHISQLIVSAFRKGNKLLMFGNGGSAADAQHLAAEFVNRLVISRAALPALALTTDTSILTSVSNDFDFEDIFVRQIEAFGKPGDIAMGISTSGNSGNVVRAIEAAHRLDMITLGLLGGDGGQLKALVDYSLIVPSSSAQRIQETHITLGHAICEWVENSMFAKDRQHDF